MKSRKPRANLHQLRSLAHQVRTAQTALDLAIADAVREDVPWRIIAGAIDVPATSVRRRFSTTGQVRHRWPTAPRALEE